MPIRMAIHMCHQVPPCWWWHARKALPQKAPPQAPKTESAALRTPTLFFGDAPALPKPGRHVVHATASPPEPPPTYRYPRPGAASAPASGQPVTSGQKKTDIDQFDMSLFLLPSHMGRTGSPMARRVGLNS